MQFALDDDARFRLVANEGGWDLIFDDRRVHYCRQPASALAYMAEELGEEATADGVEEVLDSLTRIEGIVAKAAVVIDDNKSAATAARVLGRVWGIEDQRTRVREASLELAGCRTVQELRARPDHKHIVTRAKAIVATMKRRP